LLVGEPQNHVILTLEVSVPPVIPGGLLIPIMDLSVKLHDKPAITATEICDERTDRNLPQKFQIHELPASQPLPQHLLGWSRALAQGPSQCPISSHTTSSPVCGCTFSYKTTDLLVQGRKSESRHRSPSSPGEGGAEGAGEEGRGDEGLGWGTWPWRRLLGKHGEAPPLPEERRRFC